MRRMILAFVAMLLWTATANAIILEKQVQWVGDYRLSLDGALVELVLVENEFTGDDIGELFLDPTYDVAWSYMNPTPTRIDFATLGEHYRIDPNDPTLVQGASFITAGLDLTFTSPEPITLLIDADATGWRGYFRLRKLGGGDLLIGDGLLTQTTLDIEPGTYIVSAGAISAGSISIVPEPAVITVVVIGCAVLMSRRRIA